MPHFLLQMMLLFSRSQWLFSWYSLLFLQLGIGGCYGKNDPSVPYTSVRALDEFGNSIQLQHAREAARRHGRLIVAAATKNPSVKSSDETIVVISVGDQPVLHSLTLPGHDSSLAMCYTGVRSDGLWLSRQVQQYVTRVWERYDQDSMPPSAVAHWVARVLGRFEGHDWKNELQSKLRWEELSAQDNEDRRKYWGRPLGVQTMILSTRQDSPPILLVEPSGRILMPSSQIQLPNGSGWFTGAMGKDSDVVERRLQRFKVGDDTDEVSEISRALIKVILESMSQSSSSPIALTVETIHRSGSQHRILHYKNGREWPEP